MDGNHNARLMTSYGPAFYSGTVVEGIMSQIIQLASAVVEAPRGPLREHRDPAVRTDAVYVIYTSIDGTLAAVRVAGDFARALGVPVTLIHFRAVSYALSVDERTGK